jgi:hypothetical protein
MKNKMKKSRIDDLKNWIIILFILLTLN